MTLYIWYKFKCSFMVIYKFNWCNKMLYCFEQLIYDKLIIIITYKYNIESTFETKITKIA